MSLIEQLKKTQRVLSSKKVYIPVLVLVFILIILATLSYKSSPPKASCDNAHNNLSDGRYTDVIKACETELTKDTSNLQLTHTLATAYLGKMATSADKKPWFTKIYTLLSASIKSTDNTESERMLGYAYFLIGNYPAANDYYNKAIALEPRNSVALADIGQLYEAINNIVKANRYYKDALAIDATNELAQIGEIRNYYRYKNFATMRDRATKLLAKTDNMLTRASIEEILGIYELSQKDTARAKTHLAKALSYNPVMPVALASYAKALLDDIYSKPFGNISEQTKIPESLALQAVTIRPNYSYAYAVLSRIETLKGDKEKASEYGLKVLSSLSTDTLLSSEDKKTLAKSFSTSTPIQSTFKVISVTEIAATSSGALTIQKQ